MLDVTEKRKVPILMYHSISSFSDPRFRQFTVSPLLFAEQMAYLYNCQYTPITVTQLIQARSKKTFIFPERPVVLTFDDGFADFFTAALPVLKQYDFPATLYVSTAFVNGTSRWLLHERETTRRMLTWQQLAEISTNRIECGAHGHSHPQLDMLSYTAACDEITRSKKLLEDQLEREIFSFAYPFGYYTAQVQRLVREAGYTSACAVRHRKSSETDDPFALARLMVHGDSTLNEFAASLTGRSSSPASAVYKIYARARTPVWQFVRRSATSAIRCLTER